MKIYLKARCGMVLRKIDDRELKTVFEYITDNCSSMPSYTEVAEKTGIHPVRCRRIMRLFSTEPPDERLYKFLEDPKYGSDYKENAE